MERGETGRYEVTVTGGEAVRAFVPAPLPPGPPLDFDGGLQRALEAAALAVGRLDGVSTQLPDTSLFLYAYVRKEAVLSSQIEGTQSSLSDLLLFELEEAHGVPLDDIVEVSNYVAALDHGLARLRGGFPLSNRLIREIHGVLLARGRGRDKAPGELRARRTGSAAPDLETRVSSRRPTRRSRTAWPPSSGSSTPKATACRSWCARDWRMSSSRRSTPFLTATDASAAC
jgi:hypothetical protein